MWHSADTDSTELDCAGLNTAISEASCLGMAVDRAEARIRIPLEVLTMPEDGPPQSGRRVDVVLDGVSRVAASLRFHWWTITEPERTVMPLTLDGLNEAVKTFGGSFLHGWEFFDLPEPQWRELVSFDTALADETSPHALEFTTQEGTNNRELDVRVWFRTLAVTRADETPIPLSQFIADGNRWWNAHSNHDPRTMDAWHVHPPL